MQITISKKHKVSFLRLAAETHTLNWSRGKSWLILIYFLRKSLTEEYLLFYFILRLSLKHFSKMWAQNAAAMSPQGSEQRCSCQKLFFASRRAFKYKIRDLWHILKNRKSIKQHSWNNIQTRARDMSLPFFPFSSAYCWFALWLVLEMRKSHKEKVILPISDNAKHHLANQQLEQKSRQLMKGAF